MSMPSGILAHKLAGMVQHNCNISDALHAHNYSLCIYLLKMREFYRWEKGFAYRDPLPKGPLGEWISEREQLWQTLEEKPFRPIMMAGQPNDPYHTGVINEQIESHGLLYSGGYCGAKPHFFLAELEQKVEEEGTTIYIAGREFAREITAPPALSLDNTVFLRRESLSRMIWEKLEEWGWQDSERAIARASRDYEFDRAFDQALEKMTGDELQTLLQHELGEVAVGRELGQDWEAMLATLPRSRAEFTLRAIRDHLVDCRRTLPWLLEEQRDASLHFYMANFTTLRKEIFPALTSAYMKWLGGDRGKQLRETFVRGADHWQGLAEQALALYRQHGDDVKQLMREIDSLDAKY